MRFRYWETDPWYYVPRQYFGKFLLRTQKQCYYIKAFMKNDVERSLVNLSIMKFENCMWKIISSLNKFKRNKLNVNKNAKKKFSWQKPFLELKINREFRNVLIFFRKNLSYLVKWLIHIILYHEWINLKLS